MLRKNSGQFVSLIKFRAINILDKTI